MFGRNQTKRMLATCLFATLVGTLPAFGAEGDAVARARMAAMKEQGSLPGEMIVPPASRRETCGGS
ncbi:hypothetical protein [Geobacter sulfurreducens]|uniref:hypothetical protein n=1 Tax=Geobacter sulfurreducens TaxID=35554 RepID=UPI002CBA659F|nr:hypothetical protein [Geobacter sulfurreducens]HML77234.1 hypothetical protein [Geobacter sulfurreducens]